MVSIYNCAFSQRRSSFRAVPRWHVSRRLPFQYRNCYRRGRRGGAGIGYLVLRNHNRGKVTGCLQSADNAGRLLDDNQKTYALINPAAVPLQTGERVELRGKRIRQSSGTFAFEIHGLIKDYGPCQQ